MNWTDFVIAIRQGLIPSKKELTDGTTQVGNAKTLDGHGAEYFAKKEHGHSSSEVGLGNVPNVATDDQTPTFTVASANAELTSGERLTVAFGKIAKAIKSLIAHLTDSTSHITSAERTTWNGKANASHNQGASTITTGTLGGKVQANASAMGTLTNAQVRDIVIKASVAEGGSASESNGTIVFTKG